MQIYPTYDVCMISTFRNLRVLELKTDGLMRGRYPCLFDFPMLEKFKLEQVYSKVLWDFSMLAGFPQLKELYVGIDYQIKDDISNLRILKNTLQKVRLGCHKVSGNFMVFADFPQLKTLDLDNEIPKLCGDIRAIKSTDFPSIKDIILPYNCFGAGKIERIADAKDCMLVVYNLRKQFPSYMGSKRRKLAHNSPDRYEFEGDNSFLKPPFHIDFVKVGPRCGWRWTNCCVHGCCELNWFDPEPEEGSSEHEVYMSVLKYYRNDVDFFKGFYGPPTEEELGELLREKSSLYSQCTGQRL